MWMWCIGVVQDGKYVSLTEAPRPGEALGQAEDMPGDMVHRAALGHMALDVRAQLAQHLAAGRHRALDAEQLLIDPGQQVGVVIGLAAQHHPVEGLQVLLALLEGLDAAVEDELQVREVALELRRHRVAQRRHLAVLLGRQALENGDARMYGETAAAGLGHLANEIA
jgi:hypothetical protein